MQMNALQRDAMVVAAFVAETEVPSIDQLQAQVTAQRDVSVALLIEGKVLHVIPKTAPARSDCV